MERLHTAITGSSGFLGEALVNRLEQQNKEVSRLNRTGFIPSDAQLIIDCAAFGNLASQRKDAKEIYKANLWRVFTEMEHLTPNQRFIYISSSSVMRPKQNLYSLSKKAAEEYLQFQDKQIAIVRPFSITGMGDQEEHLIPTLIRSCLTGEEMPFVSEPHHDYIDVDDVVDALLTIAKHGQFKGEIYQVGTGRSISNQEVKDIVEEMIGKKANTYEVESLRDYDSANWVADTTRIHSLGWSPKKGIKQTIAEMIYARTNITN